jgi:capsular polysaccharide biosynthesis protein
MANEKKAGNNYDFASTDILIYIWAKRIPLGIIAGAAAILSILVSLTITPMFKSTVILFPTANATVSKNLLADNYSGKSTIYEIGEEEQAEQLLQVLLSEEMKNMVMKKFDLKEHYGIDPESAYPLTQLDAMFRSNVHFKRTEYMSVEVDVMDKDPQMAADIANTISFFTDSVYNQALKERAVEAFQLVEKEFNELGKEISILKDSLDVIRQLGINNYNSQADRYHEAYGKALVSGNSQAIKTLEKKLEIMSEYGGTYDVLASHLALQISVYNRLKQRQLEAKVEAEQSLPHIFIVDKAIKAEKKAYPKKSIIVVVSTLTAFLFGLILLIISDNLKKKLT